MTKYSLATKRSDDMPNRPRQASEAGQTLVFIIIVIAVIGAGLLFLNSMRKDAKVEGERFAHELIEKCAFQHDVKWLHGKVASDRRVTIPPAMDDQFIYYLNNSVSPIATINWTVSW